MPTLSSTLSRTTSGPDELPYWFWNTYAYDIAPVITTIFNTSIKLGIVPDEWKLANLLPIPKESPCIEPNQLRPISLTNIIVRLFERAIYTTELSPVMEKVIHEDQFAYKKGHSSTMALIKAQHTWMEWLDGDASVVRVFSFDFSKAFDTVPHEILCNKLKELPISPYIINWIIDFLTSRYQRVVIDGIKTDYLPINRGVPQGTVLGPILFSIMINDIRPVQASNLIVKFADDINLHSQKRASCSKSAADLLQVAIIKPISGCVRIACSGLMTTSLLQVVNRLAASCELQTCCKLRTADLLQIVNCRLAANCELQTCCKL